MPQPREIDLHPHAAAATADLPPKLADHFDALVWLLRIDPTPSETQIWDADSGTYELVTDRLRVLYLLYPRLVYIAVVQINS